MPEAMTTLKKIAEEAKERCGVASEFCNQPTHPGTVCESHLEAALARMAAECAGVCDELDREYAESGNVDHAIGAGHAGGRIREYAAQGEQPAAEPAASGKEKLGPPADPKAPCMHCGVMVQVGDDYDERPMSCIPCFQKGKRLPQHRAEPAASPSTPLRAGEPDEECGMGDPRGDEPAASEGADGDCSACGGKGCVRCAASEGAGGEE